MAISVTNQKAYPSLNGQAVLVTLNSTDAAELENLSEGQICTNASSSKTGTIHRVDYYGTSFWINPIQPDKNFASAGVYGYLAAGETVNITT